MFKLVLNYLSLTSCSLQAVKNRNTNCSGKLQMIWRKSIKFKTETELQKIRNIHELYEFCFSQKIDKDWGVFVLAIVSWGFLWTGTPVKLDQNFSKLLTYINRYSYIYIFCLNTNISNLNKPFGRSTLRGFCF